MSTSHQSFEEHKKVKGNFRGSRLRILVSSPVGDEGLDFPMCSCIFLFSKAENRLQWIQKLGRARAENSKVYRKNPKQKDRWSKVEVDELTL